MSNKIVDLALKNAGAKPGVEIWMIQDKEVVTQPKSSFGDFYRGNSFIILVTKRESRGLEWDIHFWIGKETSEADAAIAVHKLLELDEMLGGCTTQYREVEGFESKEFCRLFPVWIRYLCNPLKMTKKDPETVFYHIKGKQNVRVSQEEPCYKAMNRRDVFILDDGSKIFCWNGPESSKIQRIKAIEVARRIRDYERGGLAEIILVDDNAGTKVEEDFFQTIGTDGQMLIDNDSLNDDIYGMDCNETVSLHRVLEKDANLLIEEIRFTALARNILKSEGCFILDSGPKAVFIWVGKYCSRNEKRSALSNAMEFVKRANYPVWTQVTRILEGKENIAFRRYFEYWEVEEEFNRNAKANQFEDNAVPAIFFQTFQDIGNSCADRTEIWLISSAYPRKLDPSTYGLFFDADCYVVLHNCLGDDIKGNCIIYCWQGLKSSKVAKDASRQLAIKFDQEFGNLATLIQINQGAETNHFLRLFPGHLIVLQGNNMNGNEGIRLLPGLTEYTGIGRLFQIQGTEHWDIRVIQVDVSASKLNSNDVFLLEKKSISIVWEGKGVTEEIKMAAEEFAIKLRSNGDLVIIQEGSETEEFWQLLGGRSHYNSVLKSEAERKPKHAKLYQCTNIPENLDFIEIRDFDQSELCGDDIMILNTHNEIYIWIGKVTSDEERNGVFHMTINSGNLHEGSNKCKAKAIIEVKQGCEPVNFTQYFPSWVTGNSTNNQSYESILAKMAIENERAAKTINESAKYDQVYSYKELKQKHKAQSLDICNKEKYLSNEEFHRVFGISKVEFYMKPAWKQVWLKKLMGLY